MHSCRQAGIEIVPERSERTIALGFVKYSEAKGPGFSPFGVGEPVGFGTNIAFELTLLDARTATTLLQLTVEAGTSGGVPKERFHSSAVEVFKARAGYRLSCNLIAGALGVHDQAAKALPWAVIDTTAREALQRMGFTPTTTAERAAWAVVHRDFAQAEVLGPEAVPSLLLLIRNADVGRDGFGVFSATCWDNDKVLAKAAELLGKAGDPRAAQPLLEFLKYWNGHKRTPARSLVPLFSAVLGALGKVGDAYAVPVLEEWSHASEGVGAVANSALQELRQRLTSPVVR
jgi:hypothetical protein